jgi:hypothetical protein
MEIAVSAAASEPERRVIKWEDAFAGADTAALKKHFEKQWQATYAALSFDSEVVGEVTQSDEDGHAEDHLLADNWPIASERARQAARAGRRATIVVAINRTPCAECTPKLVRAIKALREDPAVAEKTRFILAPTGVYEPRRILTPEEIRADRAQQEALAKKLGAPLSQVIAKSEYDEEKGFTRASHLNALVDAGWDLHALLAREKPTSAGIVLAKYAHNLAVKFKRTAKAAA